MAEALDVAVPVPAGSRRNPALAVLLRLHDYLQQEQRPAPPVQYTGPLVAYVGLIAIVASVLATLLVRRPQDAFGTLLISAAITGMAATSVRSLSGIDLIFGASTFLHLGLSLVAGPAGALAASVGECIGVAVRFRVGAFRSTFNLSQLFLSNLAAWAAFLGVMRLPGSGAVTLAIAGVAAGLANFVVNHTILSGVFAVTSGGGYLGKLRNSMISASPYQHFFYGYAASGFVALVERFGPFGFTFALAPVVALQAFIIVLARRTRLHEEQRSQLLERLREEGIRVQRSYDATLIALTHALDARDKETEGHSRRVVEYTRMVAVRLGIDGDDLKLVCHGALLHDIGKIGVPDAILHKPGPLTEAEWQVMRRHPEIGALMVEEVDYLAEARRIILHHHERWDGRGYPLGLRGRQITVGARAFAVADTFDAITQDRPYRRGRSFDEACEEILHHRGTQFDPDAVDAFLAIPEDALRAVAGIRQRVGLDLLAGARGTNKIEAVFGARVA